MHTYPADALFASRTAAPTGGVPSLTPAEIVQLYQWWMNRPPDSTEMASEQDNSLKYSAAGIERQIANRAGNVASSGIRGDEGQPSLTVQPPPPVPVEELGHVITLGPSASPTITAPVGPTGTIPAGQVGGSAIYPQYYTQPGAAAPMLFGFSLTTVAVVAVMAGAAWYFLARR